MQLNSFLKSFQTIDHAIKHAEHRAKTGKDKRFWQIQAWILRLYQVGLTDVIVEFEHYCKDCGKILWEPCACQDLSECKLYPLCQPCLERRIGPL